MQAQATQKWYKSYAQLPGQREAITDRLQHQEQYTNHGKKKLASPSLYHAILVQHPGKQFIPSDLAVWGVGEPWPDVPCYIMPCRRLPSLCFKRSTVRAYMEIALIRSPGARVLISSSLCMNGRPQIPEITHVFARLCLGSCRNVTSTTICFFWWGEGMLAKTRRMPSKSSSRWIALLINTSSSILLFLLLSLLVLWLWLWLWFGLWLWLCLSLWHWLWFLRLQFLLLLVLLLLQLFLLLLYLTLTYDWCECTRKRSMIDSPVSSDDPRV